MNDDTPLVRLHDVTKRYPTPEGVEALEVLSGITLEIAAGRSLAVVGPSGSGKSTLLNIMGALDKPTSGVVTLAGRDLAGMDEDALSLVRNRDIGFVFQMHHLLPHLTVLENVLVPTLVHQSRGESCVDRARRLLDRFGLAARSDYRPGRLSGGECQRTAVVRALINGPKLLLADEPTGSLDRDTAEHLADLLVELNREEGVTLVVVSHSLELARRMETVCKLSEGTLSPFDCDAPERHRGMDRADA